MEKRWWDKDLERTPGGKGGDFLSAVLFLASLSLFLDLRGDYTSAFTLLLHQAVHLRPVHLPVHILQLLKVYFKLKNE